MEKSNFLSPSRRISFDEQIAATWETGSVEICERTFALEEDDRDEENLSASWLADVGEFVRKRANEDGGNSGKQIFESTQKNAGQFLREHKRFYSRYKSSPAAIDFQRFRHFGRFDASKNGGNSDRRFFLQRRSIARTFRTSLDQTPSWFRSFGR